jgi:imidazolonepropionase-like amidohydrolase
MRIAVLAALLFSLGACQPAQEDRTVAIVGAVLIDGAGGPPLTDSMVLVGGGRILAAGRRTELSIPAGANVIDGGGQYIVPLPIDVTVGGVSLPRIATLAEARSVVAGGAAAFIGMVRDTADLDPSFVSQLRDLKVVVAPSLVAAGTALEMARRNTQRLFAAGVPIAVAGNGDPLREAELLADAGIPPLDVIVAATRNGALALGQFDRRGVIQPGKQADLLLLTVNPGEDIRNLRKVTRRMVDGEWR